jgi:hypothetical protein
MDNSSTKSFLENISETIKNNDAASNPSTIASSGTTNEKSWLSSLFSVSITTWIIIILILAFLGFNIFIYLAKGTESVNNLLTPIIKPIASFFAAITGQVVNTTATGAKAVVDTTSEVLDTGLTGVQNATAQGKKAISTSGGVSISDSIPHADVMQNNTLNKALNKSNVEKNIGQNSDYVADDSTSNIQKTQSKGGYCYIGEERGHRSCMRVNENDTCVSGEIFPTSEICINPSLRV